MTRSIRLPIVNLRLGHACNSSSSHSILIRSDVDRLSDASSEEFGWDWFTASASESKRAYLALGVAAAIKEDVGDDDLAKLIGASMAGVSQDAIKGGYIDHQSLPLIPVSWSGKGVDVGFVSAWRTFLERDDVAILGGNDNEEWQHGAATRDEVTQHPDGEGRPVYVCRQDGDVWTLFCRETGARVSLNFTARESADYQAKSDTIVARSPWLVDLKITDACNAGCAYCYQGSTPDGAHAPKDALVQMLYALAELRCFEVAIGGGEPTLHPDFFSILNTARRLNVVPNITTRNITTLSSVDDGPRLAEAVGRIAVSLDSPRQLERLVNDVLPRAPWLNDKLNVQIIDGIMDSYGIDQILRLAEDPRIPVTLLGYKGTGRGSLMKPKHLGAWEKAYSVEEWAKGKKGPRFPLTVDTAFLKTYEKSNRLKCVDTRTAMPTEGLVSCYVDAVRNTMHRSSYDLEVEVVLPSLADSRIDQDAIINAWQRIRVN